MNTLSFHLSLSFLFHIHCLFRFTHSSFSLYSIYSTAPSSAWSEVDHDALPGSIALWGRLEVSVRGGAPCFWGLGLLGGGICPTFRAWSDMLQKAPPLTDKHTGNAPEKFVVNFVRGTSRKTDIQKDRKERMWNVKSMVAPPS